MAGVSHRTVGRLILYERLLAGLRDRGERMVRSHELAAMAGVTAAQVRRDLMSVECSGSPRRGYDVERLIEAVRRFLSAPKGERAALVGIGNLGRAIAAYLRRRGPELTIGAAFDADPAKARGALAGCPCYPVSDMAAVIRQKGICVGIIAVPAHAAQAVADGMVAAGVRGIVNFAPAALRVPPGVHVEDMDMTVSLAKAAYFAHHPRKPRAAARRRPSLRGGPA
jgi:redox-sensing transcriptional repressor